MKRLSAVLCILVVLFSISGCSTTHVRKTGDVTLTFIYEDKNINIVLMDDEAEKVIDILDGKRYDPISFSTPSCGFSTDIALRVGNRVFPIARDTCNCVQDLSNLRYFNIPTEDINYIHSLFEKYGGYFPCI